MTNTPNTVDWALGQGANAIEVDLQFEESGIPTVFKHGGPFCDCLCAKSDESVCGQLSNFTALPCDASTDSIQLLAHVAQKSNLYLVIIDSKVGDLDPAALQEAGGRVVRMLNAHLFSSPSFVGQVVIGMPKLATAAYLEAAAAAAGSSPNASRIFFTIDQEGDAVKKTAEKLVAISSNRVYGTGISACLAGSYQDAIAMAAYNQQVGVFGFVYIWTLDKASSMLDYLENGAQGIMTNFPGRLLVLAQEEGIPLATSPSLPASSNPVFSWPLPGICDCDYHPGGCSISEAAPPKSACHCTYEGAWTCSGKLVVCRDQSSPFCAAPGKSIESCLQGKGDCEGYEEVTCDCDYHPGGCSISKAAPKDTACRCEYKGAWTCGGTIVSCLDSNSPFCLTPDTSINSCLQGRGDCEGYKEATCDCDYHPGGCSISRAAPRDTACQCEYKGAWTCGGKVVNCTDPNSPSCKSPDTSIQSCFQGRGDCEGYAEATCDCDYHRGGCTISKAAPKGTACRCDYKGFWTCGGSIVRCNDPNSAFCKNPDQSLGSCLLGSGDCGGY